MPELITCPECQGKLRIKDELLGKKIKCPKCQKAFVAKVEEKEPAEPEEIEEEEAPARPAARKRRDEDEDERPRKKRRDEEEEEEDDRPRKKRRDEEDEEEEDAPKKKRRDEEEEEEEERPRKKRRDDEDEDEDGAKKKASSPEEMLKWLRLSLMLVFIGTCVTLGTTAMRFLLLIIALSMNGLYDWIALLLVGLPGLGGTAAFTTGLVFGIFGPHKKTALAMSIAVISTAGLHLLFALIAILIGVSNSMGYAARAWLDGATTLPALTMLGRGMDVLAFFAGLFELGSLVVLCLWFRAVKLNYQKRVAFSQFLLPICFAGGAPFFLMLLNLILFSAAPGMAVFWVSQILTGLLMIAVYVFYMLLTLNVWTFVKEQRVK